VRLTSTNGSPQKIFHIIGHQYYAIVVHPNAEILVSFSNNNTASVRTYEVKTVLNLGCMVMYFGKKRRHFKVVCLQNPK